MVDKEDFSQVKAKGNTWFYYIVNGYPYAFANILGKRVYLDRLILDTLDGMQVDHFDYNSLDNRKRNLRNVMRSQDMQNRRGSRKGSKSGIRGVS